MTNGSTSERGEGWVGFASLMMVIAGALKSRGHLGHLPTPHIAIAVLGDMQSFPFCCWRSSPSTC
jgi:hypothetical protein